MALPGLEPDDAVGRLIEENRITLGLAGDRADQNEWRLLRFGGRRHYRRRRHDDRRVGNRRPGRAARGEEQRPLAGRGQRGQWDRPQRVAARIAAVDTPRGVG